MRVAVSMEIEVDPKEWAEWRHLARSTQGSVRGDLRHYVQERLDARFDRFRATGRTLTVSVRGAVEGRRTHPREWGAAAVEPAPEPEYEGLLPYRDTEKAVWVCRTLTHEEQQQIVSSLPASWGIVDAVSGVLIFLLEVRGIVAVLNEVWTEYGERLEQELGYARPYVDTAVVMLRILHGRVPTYEEVLARLQDAPSSSVDQRPIYRCDPVTTP